MIFEVFRTSSDYKFDENKKPCKNARLHTYTYESERREWIDGHTIIQVRKFSEEKKMWVVEINTLEELLDLEREVDVELIIRVKPRKYSNTDGYIEIYDDFREI